ncbi:hypothetical protein ACRALDRAFT_1090784 [Sodiomyces alcalophilus JCM 7366]|uniref:uncharacterized protein n=1 Tax=Sodiomyces alcalophilus JCM 7366 TaxID=591952 RepID=UPI0039B50725
MRRWWILDGAAASCQLPQRLPKSHVDLRGPCAIYPPHRKDLDVREMNKEEKETENKEGFEMKAMVTRRLVSRLEQQARQQSYAHAVYPSAKILGQAAHSFHPHTQNANLQMLYSNSILLNVFSLHPNLSPMGSRTGP